MDCNVNEQIQIRKANTNKQRKSTNRSIQEIHKQHAREEQNKSQKSNNKAL